MSEPHEPGIPTRSDVVGWTFPGGSFVIDAAENALLCRLLGATPSDNGTAHPLYAYIAAQRSMGIGVGELIERFGSSVDGGAMLGSVRLELAGRLQVGRTYQVTGEIRSVTRKQSTKLGAFDLAEFELRLADDAGERTSSRSTFVLPVRGDGS